jgi:beta-catenin-like protein 1
MVPENQALFRSGEGLELMIRMIREKRFCKHSAMKVLDYAVTKNAENCQGLVAAEGLKVLFPAFMGKVGRCSRIAVSLHLMWSASQGYAATKKQVGLDAANSEEEHTIAVVAWLFRLLPEGSIDRLRLLRKFEEDNFEKVERLVDYHMLYLHKVESAPAGMCVPLC